MDAPVTIDQQPKGTFPTIFLLNKIFIVYSIIITIIITIIRSSYFIFCQRNKPWTNPGL